MRAIGLFNLQVLAQFEYNFFFKFHCEHLQCNVRVNSFKRRLSCTM